MIPAWAMLGICYLGPLLHLYDDMMVYVLSVIFVWTPIVAVSLLLCLRLDFNASGLPLYKIFTPLWAVDLVALLFPAFLFLVVIIRSRYRPEHLSQSSLAWLASWIILGPFVVFEVRFGLSGDLLAFIVGWLLRPSLPCLWSLLLSGPAVPLRVSALPPLYRPLHPAHLCPPRLYTPDPLVWHPHYRS